MGPEVPERLLEAAKQWDELHRWERSELGKALRRLGLTYGEIQEIIPVPKGTLSYWCRDIELSSEQIASIRRRAYSQPGLPRDTQRKRRKEVEAIRHRARTTAKTLLTDPLFTAGLALYWAEGSKTQSDLNLANTDPALLRLFILWVRSHLEPEAEFRLSLHLHEGNSERSAQQFWRRELSLSGVRFTKSYVKPAGTGHRRNRLEHGVCRVRVCRSTDLWHTTMAWIECIRVHTPSSIATLAPGR